MLNGVSSVYFFVTEIRPSRDWYEQVLGYPPEEDLEEFTLFKIGQVNLCLHRADAKSPLSTGGQVAYWAVDHFDAAVQHFLAHGGTLHRGPINAVEDLWICQLRDPFGNVIGLEGRKRELLRSQAQQELLLRPGANGDEAAGEEFSRKLEGE